MHWSREQLNWREKYGERTFPGNETVSETWFLPPILVAQCQTEIGEKAKIETPQNNAAAVVFLDQIVASNCLRNYDFRYFPKNLPGKCQIHRIVAGKENIPFPRQFCRAVWSVDDSMKNTLNASKTVIWKFVILILPSLVSTQACLTLTLVSNVRRSLWSSLLYLTSYLIFVTDTTDMYV